MVQVSKDWNPSKRISIKERILYENIEQSFEEISNIFKKLPKRSLKRLEYLLKERINIEDDFVILQKGKVGKEKAYYHAGKSSMLDEILQAIQRGEKLEKELF